MRKIIFLNETQTENTGDLNSSPLLYYDIPKSNHGDIRLFDDYDNYDIIVVGGGGLIDIEYFDKYMDKISKLENKTKVIWGAGLNGYRYTYPEYIADYDLVGLRDSI